MKKKRGIEIKINFSKRWLYTFIVIGIFAIVAVGVYAVAGVSHTPDEIDGLGDLATQDSVDWTDISNRPAGLDDGDDVGEASCSASLTNCEDVTHEDDCSDCFTCPSGKVLRKTSYKNSCAGYRYGCYVYRCCAISISCS